MAITSAVQICNSALAKVGAGRITSLDEESTESKICSEQYDKVRESLLASHPWNFAIKRAELSLSIDEPTYEFESQFQLPADCLRVLGTDQCDDVPVWKVEGRYLLANDSTMNIKYIKNESDVTKFSAYFSEALAAALAADFAYSLVQSTSLRDALIKDADLKLRFARSYDAQEGGGDRVYATSWLSARR